MEKVTANLFSFFPLLLFFTPRSLHCRRDRESIQWTFFFMKIIMLGASWLLIWILSRHYHICLLYYIYAGPFYIWNYVLCIFHETWNVPKKKKEIWKKSQQVASQLAVSNFSFLSSKVRSSWNWLWLYYKKFLFLVLSICRYYYMSAVHFPLPFYRSFPLDTQPFAFCMRYW